MNRSCFYHAAIAAAFVISAGASARAQTLSTAQILHGGTFCDHVIQLIHRHGVNNSVDRCFANSMLHHSPFGCVVIPENEFGDLQILQVNSLASDDPACGPKFAVIVQNASTRKVCDFHVTAVAVFGHIVPDSPNTTFKVVSMNPGEALEVVLQLPLEAFSMGNRNGRILGFQQLVVAIDSFDELLETNEANNIRVFNSSEIPLAAVAVQEVTAADEPASVLVEPSVQSNAQTAIVQSAAPVTAAPATVGTDTGNSVSGNSVSGIDGSGSSVDALRQAMQTLGAAHPDDGSRAGQ